MGSTTLITINNFFATSTTAGGFTFNQPSDILIMLAIILTILECFALMITPLIVITLFWKAIKKIWIH